MKYIDSGYQMVVAYSKRKLDRRNYCLYCDSYPELKAVVDKNPQLKIRWHDRVPYIIINAQMRSELMNQGAVNIPVSKLRSLKAQYIRHSWKR